MKIFIRYKIKKIRVVMSIMTIFSTLIAAVLIVGALTENMAAGSTYFINAIDNARGSMDFFLMVCALALQKILYFIQEIYMVMFGEPLYKEDCMAWVHGPVYEVVYDLFKDFKYNPIEDNRFAIFKERFQELSDQEKKVIDLVVNSFGKYSGKVLETITHNESPWKEARTDYEPLQPSREIIDKNEIKKYFSGVAKKYGIDTKEKLSNYIQSYM